MAWSASKVFLSTIEDMLENTTALDLNSDTWNITLWDNTITPNELVASANTAYGAGVWASGEQSDTTEWPAGGQALDGVTFAPTSNVLKFDATDETSDGTSATMSAMYGAMVYNATIATPVNDQGLCFLYFGGLNAVTDGTVVVVFHTNGLWTATF